MSYKYEDQKHHTLTDQGQLDLMDLRAKIAPIVKLAGCIRADEAMNMLSGTRSNWEEMAFLDRLVELNLLIRVPMPDDYVGQWQVFMAGSNL